MFILIFIFSLFLSGFVVGADHDFEKDFKRIYNCSEDQSSEIKNLNFCNYKVPILSLVPKEQINYDKAYVTVLLRPMYAWWNSVGVKTDHCAFVAEYFEKSFFSRKLTSRLVSLETKGGGDINSSDVISSNSGTHSVNIYENTEVINLAVWSHDPIKVDDIFRRNLVFYYPYVTFVADKNKVLQALKTASDEKLQNSYSYNVRGNNCCDYVLKRLQEMGVPLQYNTCYKDKINPIFTSGQLKRSCDEVKGVYLYKNETPIKKYTTGNKDFRVYASDRTVQDFVEFVKDNKK